MKNLIILVLSHDMYFITLAKSVSRFLPCRDIDQSGKDPPGREKAAIDRSRGTSVSAT